jgi:murein DD-endopeptidase MepM/ murein hydrolase activator NlpD
MFGIAKRLDEGSSGLGKSAEVWSPNMIVNGVGKAVLVRFGHLSSFDPSFVDGAFIGYGAPVGVWGDTGYSFGIHVHYEVRVGPTGTSASQLRTGEALNPLDFNIQIDNGRGCTGDPTCDFLYFKDAP